jgi:hypothetical protein
MSNNSKTTIKIVDSILRLLRFLRAAQLFAAFSSSGRIDLMRLNSRRYWIVPVEQTFHAAKAAPRAMQTSSKNAVVQGVAAVATLAEVSSSAPLERNHSSDKKSRQTKKLERILIAKVRQLLRYSLLSSVRDVNALWKSPILALGRLGLFNPPLAATAPS